MKKREVILRYVMLFIISLLSVRQVYSAEKQEKKEKDVTILFTSDVHGKTKESLVPFLNRFVETVSDTEYICFGGDYEKSYEPEIISEIVQTVKKSLPDTKAVYTIGNHDRIGLDAKGFEKITGNFVTGRLIQEKGYMIYTIGASSEKQEFSEDDLCRLKTILEESKTIIPKEPIFIVSHYPIHYYERDGVCRTTKNAKEMIELLNEYSNVIFLYGHNHTMQDENYSLVHMPGDNLEIGKESYETINFAYAALGCMEDGAGQDIYAIKATLVRTPCCNKVSLEHLNSYAEPKDKLMICFPLATDSANYNQIDYIWNKM